MLRHKCMINLSLSKFRQCTQFYNSRDFHSTDCFFLRRIASSRKLNSDIKSSEENVVAGNFEEQSVTKTFNNFYGIESDEGVIHIRAEPNSSKQDSFINKFTSKQMSEKFKQRCFGKVRFDSENKLVIHGQYEENTSVSDFSELGNATRLRKFAIQNADADTRPSVEQELLSSVENPCDANSKFDSSGPIESEKYPTRSQLKVSKFDAAEEHNREALNDVSLIDESYFPEKLLKDLKTNVSNSLNLSEDVACKHEFESKQVSNKDVHSSNVNANLDIGDAKFNDSSLKENHLLSEEKNSFFDELAFGSILENKNIERTEKPMAEITPKSVVKNHELLDTTSVSNNNVKPSFIDDYYFNDRLENKQIEKDSNHTTKNIPETSLNYSVAKKARSHDIEKEEVRQKSKTVLKVKNTEYKTDKISNYKSETKFSNRMSNEPETSFSNSHELNQTPNIDPPMWRQSDNTYKSSNNETVNEQLNPIQSFRSMLSSNETSGLPRDKNATVLDRGRPTRTNVPENMEATSSRKEVNDQKQGPEDQHETAFDFVKKLRGDKVLTYHEKISGISGAPIEKLDSKGFRILKHQVPELKYFTRDEMLELLVKNVLYSDDDVIVLNKPYNLVMHESNTTKDACLSKYLDDLAGELDKKSKSPKLLTVHRLDKETTGCLLLARNETSAQYLKSLFAQRKIVKTYWIVTIKVPDPLQGIIDIPIVEGFVDNKSRMVLNPNLPKDIPYRNHSSKGKNAVTHYNVISQSGNAALVEVKPETGIKHQIRVHFGLGLACPILGDHKYSYPDKLVPQKLQTDLLHKLHVRQSKVRYIPMHIYARSIFIPQYNVGRNLFVMAPMPIHMSKNLQRLKFRKK